MSITAATATLIVLASTPSAAQEPPLPEVDQSQVTSLVITYGASYGAYVGGTGAWLIGEALEENEAAHDMQGVLPGVLGGSAVGATLAYFVDNGKQGSPESAALLFGGTGLGLYYGEELGRMLIPVGAPGARERIRAAGLAGSMAGLGLGTAYGGKAAPVGRQVHVWLANGVGWVGGKGIGNLAGWDSHEDRRKRALSETGASLALTGLAVAANNSGLEAPRAPVYGLTAIDGTWFGMWAPYLFSDEPTELQKLGGAEVGLGVGYVTAVGMTAFGQPSGKSFALQTAGLAAGSALGAGIPLSTGSEGPARDVVAPMLATGAAGQILGAVVAPRYELEANDRLLLGTLETWTLYQAVGWSVFASETGVSDTEAVGYALTAGGAGSLLAMGLVPVLDVEPEGSTMLISGGAWGTWFGAWGSQIAGSDAEQLWLASLVAGDGALAASALAQGLGWEPTWRQAAYANGFGLVGAAAGGLLGTVALYDPDDWTPVSSSVVVGSGVGLVAGGILGAMPSRRDRTPQTHAAPPRLGGGLTSRLPFDTHVQALPWTGEDGSPGLFVQLDLSER